jgi:hypothetical protein
MSKPKDTDLPLALLRECFVLDPDVVSGALWRFRVILAVAAFALAGCNANQAINPSDRCSPNDADCNPYNPVKYAQNTTGIGR